MDIRRISIPLSVEEERALKRQASQSCRRPRDHARFLVLKSLGLIGNEPTNNDKTATTSELSQGKQVGGFAEVR